jgi:2-polyprenyl-6-methoxyphenol hydroxylase-like FAD-dependent oxidoreductase
MVLRLLLARAGVEVSVLEKHGDFLRDFRGDTVHPSTLQLLDELGLGERFASLPQPSVRDRLSGRRRPERRSSLTSAGCTRGIRTSRWCRSGIYGSPGMDVGAGRR